MWLAVCLTRVRSQRQARYFLFYPSLENLSTALLSHSCWSTVYTAGALTSLCEVGGWQSTQGVFQSHGATASSCVLSLTAAYYPVRPNYGDYLWYNQYQLDLSQGNIA